MKSKEHPDVQAAVLAVHLGMIEEAEQILIGLYHRELHKRAQTDVLLKPKWSEGRL